MKNVANSRFTIKSWDEKPYSEGQDLPKLTRAAVTKSFTGDIAGEGHVEYLMMYRGDGSATFVGLERSSGTLQGRRAVLCSNALEYSRTAWRRSPIPSSLAPEPESFEACAARAARTLGTGLSIL